MNYDAFKLSAALGILLILESWCSGDTFRIRSLETNNAVVVDINSFSGDDRGGIAVTGADRVFYNGDSRTAGFDAVGLTNGAAVNRRIDGLCSDLKTGKLYALGNGTNELNSSGGTFTTLIGLNPTNATPLGTAVTLSRSIAMSSSGNGIFSGYGRILIYTGGRVFHVRPASGLVTDLGAMARPAWQNSENWSIWGVAENTDDTFYLTYRRSGSATIERAQVPDGSTSTVATFTNLSDMASITVSPSLGRWFFHHESTSQFGGGAETLGSASAQFDVIAGIEPPRIVSVPESVSQLAPRPVSFQVEALGSEPLTFQWQSNGVAIVGETNSTFSIAQTAPGHSANYSVVVSAAGAASVTSSNAVLTVLPVRADGLKILGFSTNAATIVDINSNTGDDRGGLALSTSHVFVNGDSRTAGFALSGLTNAVNATRRIDGLCADLQTREIYALSDGTNELTSSGGTLRALAGLDGATAGSAGSTIPLSRPIAIPSGRIGIFSGWGRIVIYASGAVYEILLPTGDVVRHGEMAEPPWSTAEIGDVFGVVERFDDSLHLVYPRFGTETIERSRVPDGNREVITTFNNIADLGGLTIWPDQRRWFFVHEGVSQFGGSIETLGSADAFFDIESQPQPPGLLLHPQSQIATEGGLARFEAHAIGTGMLHYQWLFNGSPIADATNNALTVIPVSSGQAGSYSLSVSNANGSVTSSNAVLTVAPLQPDTFQILELRANNNHLIDANTVIGDDRGGLALSSSTLFATGDRATGIFDTGLSNSVSTGRIIDGLCYDLASMTVYALGNGTTELSTSGGLCDSLIELDNLNGAPTGRRIPLSTSIGMTSSGNGVFSGHGRIIIYAGGQVYDIQVPSGAVTTLGSMSRPSWQGSESWAVWGVAEKFLDNLYIVYRRSGQDIVRTRVPDGITSVINSFTNLSDMASIAVHPGLNRWYFHYEGTGQFGSVGGEVVGYADASVNRQTVPQAPVITAQPQSVLQLSPRSALFRVQAFGTAPLSYQWMSNGVPVAGATTAVYSLPTVETNHAATYSVVVSNAVGIVTSTNAVLTVLPARNDSFKINFLLADNAVTAEVNGDVGDDRAGIAVGAASVFGTGDSGSSVFDRDTLTNVASAGRSIEGLVTDLKTEKIYALANGSNEVAVSGMIVERLIEINPLTGAATTNVITLNSGIEWTFSGSGIFSGFGRIFLYTGGRLYEILLPEGAVLDHGPYDRPSWRTTELGPAWGIAESFNNELYLTYSAFGSRIDRYRISDRAVQTVAQFTNLGDIAAFTVSPSRQRWYFRHEGTSQFSSHVETLGYADAELEFEGATRLVGVFDNAQFVDTANIPTAESDNVQATVSALNFVPRTYTSISLAASRRDVLIIPDLEKSGLINVNQVPGPVIIGGDDLTDHGSVANGMNQTGWLYIQNAIANLNRDHTRQGPFTVDIAALGSSASTSTGGNAGAAIGSAANVLGLTVAYFDGATAIQGFFDSLATNGTNPKILWLAGTGAANDLDTAEGQILTANAGAIGQFVSQGGGLMAHGSGDTAYGWLNSLLPSISDDNGGTSSGHQLTDVGRAAFPLLTDANIGAGPSHNSFSGDYAGLQILGLDGSNKPFILGGRGGAAFDNRQALINFVVGGGVLIVHGSPSNPTNALTVLNEVLGSGITGSVQSGGSSFSRTQRSTGTPFADDPASLLSQRDTMTLDKVSLPTNAVSLYESTGQSLVMSAARGAGQIVFLGWDWNEAQPAGSQMGGWDVVMESAIRLRGTNVGVAPIITVEPRDAAASAGGAISLSTVAVGDAPLVYQWRFNGNNLSGQTNTSLILTGLTTNDAGAYEVVITNAVGAVTSRVATVSVVPAIARFAFDPIASPKYTNFPFEVGIRAVDGSGNTVRIFNSTVTMSTPAGITPGVSGVFTNGYWRGPVEITNLASGITISVNDGSGHSGNSGLFDVTAPMIGITRHPQSQTISEGGSITFQAAGTGSVDPLRIQWFRNGVAISGATNATLTVSNVTAAAAGTYTATISDTGGTLTTDGAVLTVDRPVLVAPGITSQPLDQRVAEGDNAIFMVTASGSGPLHYQWTKDGSLLPGATNASITVTNVQLVNTGGYRVAVSNQVGAVTSAVAQLTVFVPPTITMQPQSRIVAANASVVFQVAAVNAASFQWRRDGVALADSVRVQGVNSTNLVISRVSPDDAGVYSVVVANSVTNLVSAGATLTVGDPATLTQLGMWPDSVRGEAFGTEIVGELLYVASGSGGLGVLRYTNSTLVPVAGLRTGGSAYAAKFVNDMLYLADGEAGLRIIDVRDPSRPVLRGSYDTAGSAREVEVHGAIAYVADYNNGLEIIDVSNPASPSRRGGYDTPGLAEGLTVVGTSAYVADGARGLQIIDVSDPANPSLAGTFDTGGFARAVAVSGTNAFVADWTGGLSIVNVTDPTATRQAGVLDTGGLPIDIDIIGSTVYVADFNGGLRVIDVSDPMSPTIIGTHDTPGLALGIDVQGTDAFVADWSSGVQVVSLVTPSTPTPVTALGMAGSSWDVQVVGNHAYVADFDAGLQILQLSNHMVPRKVGGYDTVGTAQALFVTNGLAYVADGTNGLQIISVTNRTSPVRLGGIDTPGNARGVTVAGDYAYVADEAAGLHIYNVVNPSVPTFVGTYDTDGFVHAVQIVGSWAYVADFHQGLKIINVSSPTNPILGGVLATGGEVWDLVIDGTVAYLADGKSGLSIVDVSSSESPKMLGRYDTPNDAVGVSVSGSYAAVTDFEGGLRVIDVRDSGNPVQIGSFAQGLVARGVYSTEEYIYVAAQGQGLKVFNQLAGRVFAPLISLQPQSTSLGAGERLTLTVNGSGTEPLRFQWFHGSNILVGATNTTLVLTNVQLNQSGAYSVSVSNLYGRVVSQPATVVVAQVSATGNSSFDFVLSDVRMVSGVMELSFRPAADTGGRVASGLSTYRVESSADLINWTTLTTTPTPASGLLRVSDPDAGREPCRFYRVIRQ